VRRSPALPLAFLAAFLAAHAPAAAQNQVATQDIWVLDFATNQIRRFHGGGNPIGLPIALGGTGSSRGLGFNDAGLGYVARGDDVRTYDGTATTVFADATDGIAQAQDVAVRPGAAQEVWVAAGTSATNSKIIQFSSAGLVLQTFTAAGLDHPRRIVWNMDGTTLYGTSVNNKRVFSLDPGTGTFNPVADLTPQNIVPIGLAFDPTRNALWVVGDFGGNGNIGFVDVATGAYTNVLNEGQYPGLASPANVYFDRFRVLNVAARNLNGGNPGVYRINAPLGTAISDLGVVSTGITSAIDVAPRPEVIGIGAPTLAGMFVLNASLTGIVSNPITFNAPRAPLEHYAAALSPRWQPTCAPYVPGIIEPGLRIPFPDARGVPLSLADGGFLVSQTAGVQLPFLTPFPINMYLLLSGFGGILDATGQASASVDFFPAPAFFSGVQLSLAFVTFDLSTPSMFGRISDPICISIVVGP
jgi:hypothetical protein